eukprot:363841-Chlamydomonas_euryale.AAC.13
MKPATIVCTSGGLQAITCRWTQYMLPCTCCLPCAWQSKCSLEVDQQYLVSMPTEAKHGHRKEIYVLVSTCTRVSQKQNPHVAVGKVWSAT